MKHHLATKHPNEEVPDSFLAKFRVTDEELINLKIVNGNKKKRGRPPKRKNSHVEDSADEKENDDSEEGMVLEKKQKY